MNSDDYGAAKRAITDERLAKVEADRAEAIERANRAAERQKFGIVGNPADETDGDGG